MALILDADVIIRGKKGTFDLQRWVAARPDEQFKVAAITVAELRRGLERATGPRRANREQYLQAVLALMPVIPYTEQTAFEHARVWAESENCFKSQRAIRKASDGTSLGSYAQPVGTKEVEIGLIRRRNLGAAAQCNRRNLAIRQAPRSPPRSVEKVGCPFGIAGVKRFNPAHDSKSKRSISVRERSA